MAPEKRSQEESRMVLNTVIGDVAYTDQDILYLPEGMYGYEEFKRYILWEDERFIPFFWFVCIDSPGLMFPVVPPNVIIDSYEPKLPRDVKDSLKLLIVTIGDTPESVTANLRAPLAIDLDQRRAKQIILTDTQFPLRYKINRSESVLTEE